MPICIECRYPVPQLYHVSTSSKSSARPASPTSPPPGGESQRSNTGPGDVRLTQCPRCKRFADKYVEHDFVVLFIDLVLVKPQVYRHLLFNRLGREDDAFDPSIIRLGSLLLLFDVYITWSHVESLPQQITASSPIPTLPILYQYMFYLILCASMTLSQHLAVRYLAQLPWTKPPPSAPVHNTGSPVATTHHTRSLSGQVSGHGGNYGHTPSGSTTGANTPSYTSSYGGVSGGQTPGGAPPPPHANSNAVSTALFVSSCMKLFPILMVVWKYENTGGQLTKGVAWAVALQNMEALRILMGCSWWVAAVLVCAGGVAKWMIGRAILLGVGSGQVDI
ncbi:MAG: sterol homeostasis protein [Stictis urceolatum]|nr:sterol homeostasis protein [Stictis urceolata]